MDRIDEKLLLPKVDHTPAELDDASRLLLKAADIIEAGGHCKERLNTPEGARCVNGAIIKATGDFYQISGYHPLANEAIQRLRVGLGLPRVSPQNAWCDTANWNNREERTKDDVVAKLRAVALSA